MQHLQFNNLALYYPAIDFIEIKLSLDDCIT